jgi:mannose-6-phosphate isomerase-like protein (cupin superfamily)
VSGLGQVEVLRGDAGPELPLVEGGGSARAIVWPGTGARLRSMHRIELDHGAGTRALSHPSEAVYYVIAGAGEVSDEAAGTSEPLVAGSMVLVERGTPYMFTAGASGLDLVGGPAPADPALYKGLIEGS